ncbi:MAG: tRNA (N(6)-L-threonylcarbamoyladenosine(37)-C(2))-methylthiotransferase MtaB [Bacilli bacterium]|nr:tRNA (N(6)-L-threonylcarbamoyladenosine(37)-C(2))-methylthiotransferase MtaB [Bacilli bacterium]
MKFYIYTLGCKVNTYESQVVHDMLINNNYVEDEDADIYIINTCTVTNTSDSKSLKIVRRCIRNNPDAIVIVMGCMVQANPDILKGIDGVSIIIGNKYKANIPELIEEYRMTKTPIIKVEDISNTTFEEMKLNNFDRTRAFVKIEDGCNNFCTFCIIPYSRGNVRSRNPKDVIDEVKLLVNTGHKEVVLTGIHTGHYGADIDYSFSDLLNDLIKIDGLERLRISSIEITELTESFMNVLKKSKIIVDHLHIPLQSGSDTILKSMNRKYDKEYFINKVNEIRNIRPNISITTDVIVGFPGETEELFEETIDTIKKVKFSKLHVFPFSLRKGTKAEELENHIDEVTKKERCHRLIELSKELETEYMCKFVGSEVTFIPEVYKEGYLIGHTGNYLLVKYKGCEELLHKDINVVIKEVKYPYVIGE